MLPADVGRCADGARTGGCEALEREVVGPRVEQVPCREGRLDEALDDGIQAGVLDGVEVVDVAVDGGIALAIKRDVARQPLEPR